MKRWFVLGLSVITAALVLTACGGSDDPTHTPAPGAELLRDDFSVSGTWEEGVYPVDADEPASTLAIVEERYQIDHQAGRSASFIWGTSTPENGASYDNVIIDVDTEQLTEDNDNLYGVGCRLDITDPDNPKGYVLLVSGDGHYGIATLENRSLTFLVEWHQSGAINTGQAQNQLRAVCIDDYLALYVNGEFAGEATNSTYRRPGLVGLIAGADATQAVSVAFDNLVVTEGSFSN